MASILLVLSNVASLYSSVVVSVGRKRESYDNNVCWFGRLVLMRIFQWVGVMCVDTRRNSCCRNGA